MKKRNNFNRRDFIKATAVTGLGLTLNLYSCTKNEEQMPQKPKDEDTAGNKFTITDISIPLYLEVSKSSIVNIQGKGFETGDKIIFKSLTNTSSEFTADVKSATETYAVILIPENILSDKYRLTAARGPATATLGSTTLNVVFNANIPDKEGMTIKGVVYAAGAGVANVVVSDGIEVTKTDSNGIYYLPSNKKNNSVFVSIPGNYEVEKQGSAPLFFKKLSNPANTVETHDFSLTQVNNEKHVVLALGDMHLANRNNDVEQFQTGFLTDVNKSIQDIESKGTKVYALTLGDMTWETYWYENNYALPQYRTQMDQIKTTVFNSIGNHDNDPYVADDWHSAAKYRDILGPTYYSFNLGKIHYVVLDNVQYINTGGAPGSSGNRNYNAAIVAEQMEWLKKDLAMIEDKSTPIILAMHIQLNNNPTLNSSGNQTSTIRLSNSAEFMAAFNGFPNVHVLTGHTHIQYHVENSPSIMEHNSAAVCATWWWTGRNGYAGNQICKDGTPGGYVIWEMEGKDLKWTYKSINHANNYQFRAYDLNKVRITPEEHAPSYTGASSEFAKYAAEYANVNNNNEILINVWGYDTEWKVEVYEGGQPLDVNRVSVLDPLHIISYSAKRLNVNATPTADFVSTKTAHMFKARAASPTSTLEIKVTDRFGNIYTENMVRPKPFTYAMS